MSHMFSQVLRRKYRHVDVLCIVLQCPQRAYDNTNIRIVLFEKRENDQKSRLSGKWVHMYKCDGARFADFISFFLKYPMKMKKFGLIETHLFICMGYLQTGLGWGRGTIAYRY